MSPTPGLRVLLTCVDDVQWSLENSMVLHDKKFELLCHLSDKDSSLHQLSFTSELYNYTTSNSVTISPSITVKDLGVIISSDLSWYRHISTMVGKATKMSGWAINIFQDHSKVTMLTLYKSMARCRLAYCCPLLSPSSSTSPRESAAISTLTTTTS